MQVDAFSVPCSVAPNCLGSALNYHLASGGMEASAFAIMAVMLGVMFGTGRVQKLVRRVFGKSEIGIDLREVPIGRLGSILDALQSSGISSAGHEKPHVLHLQDGPHYLAVTKPATDGKGTVRCLFLLTMADGSLARASSGMPVEEFPADLPMIDIGRARKIIDDFRKSTVVDLGSLSIH
jgi:hypothetical protein